MSKPNNATCQICGSRTRLHPASLIRPAIAELIARAKPGWDPHGWICENDVQHFRGDYVRSLLTDEQGEVNALEKEVLESLREHEILARGPIERWGPRPTLGQRAADRIASFGGSWPFIAIFFAVLMSWMLINSAAVLQQPFDPFPFILLNLAFSTQAAYAAPLILLAGNRAARRDRLTLEHAAEKTDVEEAQNDELLQGNREILNRVEELEKRILEFETVIVGRLDAMAPSSASAAWTTPPERPTG